MAMAALTRLRSRARSGTPLKPRFLAAPKGLASWTGAGACVTVAFAREVDAMPKYEVRPDADSYGHAIGVILLDCAQPFVPGDVGNASTYAYPVIYRAVPGLTVDAALSGDPDCEAGVIAAALALEAAGVRGITSNCGFLLHFQEAVSGAVSVPVFMSSLLQLPLIAASLGAEAAIGVITANAGRLGNELYARAGAPATLAIHTAGLEDAPEFRSSMLDECGVLDSGRLERECVEAARGLVARHPAVGAILFECAVLPPYARAVQQATHLPVFDFVTMIDALHAATHRRAYAGAT